MKGGETALDVSLLDGVRETGLLDSSVSPVQGTGGAGLGRGPHRVNVTVPVGAPREVFPVTTAVSVKLVPCVTRLWGSAWS